MYICTYICTVFAFHICFQCTLSFRPLNMAVCVIWNVLAAGSESRQQRKSFMFMYVCYTGKCGGISVARTGKNGGRGQKCVHVCVCAFVRSSDVAIDAPQELTWMPFN